MPEGKIIKALSGFYYVKNGDDMIQCRGRGIFRKRKIVPLVGDDVVYEAENPTDGYVLDIRPRKNFLNRPPIANVDQVILVFSAAEPAFDDLLLDRFLVHVASHQIKPVICLTKIDLLTDRDRAAIDLAAARYEKIGYDVLQTSSKRGSGIDALRRRLEGAISVVAGQSGVGKSSLLNSINEALKIDTQSISRYLGRGKHTTRHVELLPISRGSYVADTPGFSSLDFADFEADQLGRFFPEFNSYSGSCRFRGCTHIAEPGCAVKQAVADGGIDTVRYEHYQLFYNEMSKRKRRY